MRNGGRVTYAVIAVGILLSCVPVLGSIYLARQQAEREMFARLDGLSSSIGRQLGQSGKALQELIATASGRGDPCTPDNVAYLHAFQVKSYGVKSVLVLDDQGHVRCSSSGDLFANLQFKNPSMRLPNGTQGYTNVRVPGLDNRLYVMVEGSGFGLLLYPYGIISPYTREDVVMGIYSPHSGELSVKHGPIEDRWTTPVTAGVASDVLIDETSGYFVVRHRPEGTYSSIAIAVPLAKVDARAAYLRRWMLPPGILGGLLVLVGTYLMTRRHLSPRAQVLRALERNQLFLEYQPVVDLQRGNVWIGAEALVRWREDDGTVLSPASFIPFAQQAGVIHLITERIMHLVRDDLADFLRTHPGFRIGMNLSPQDLCDPRTVDNLRDVMAWVGEGNGRFLVEITEEGLLDESQAKPVMQALRELGVDIAIDDFGTGYSSLSYLNTYPFNLLKIDRAFVTAACTDAINSKIAGHIVELGRTVKMEVVAEGIETEQEAALFRRWGVDFGQGYLFARPIPARELIERYPTHAPVPPPEI